MSKQSQDQDEQQAPSGEAQGGADAGTTERQPEESGKTGGSSSRRSRRRGKGGGTSTSSAGAGSASHDAAGDASAGEDGTGKPDAASGTSSSTQASEAAVATAKSSGEAEKKRDTKSSSSTTSSASASAATAGSKSATDKGTTRSTSSKADTGKAASGKTGAGNGKSGGGSDGNSGKGGKGGKAGVLALVLVILLAIAVGVFGWLGWQRLQGQQQRLAELPEQPATQAQVDDLSKQLQSAQSERKSAADSLRQEFETYRSDVNENLDKVLEQLSREQQTDERDWLHAEAAYLLRLANQRLQLERDVEGSAALLRTADARLKEADNPALMPVRREIASELAALRSVPRVDRTGLFLTLNAQQEQIAGRPLAQDVEEITGDASIEEAPSGGWQKQLSKVGEELKDLVTVRKHDEALEALISPEQESYLRQSVRLVLEQAQLALLKEEQELYDASLDKALKLIRGYYDTDDSGVQGVLSQLEELKGRSIRPELPDISGSQQALQTFIENRFEAGGDGQGDEA
ncbi:uroporphyrinogen-III C-methyltransferase [Halomonas caseinilytica]|uniref:uroporphyrinogen-III C-methyltransferase n=1 Tax=Halomonas caseinilytica TaxID=438744 RepID=UPI0007E53971|nr:uroporphyrinogen-III C-methyltransferase [Halomonas caseinilytica]SEM79082.1 uroporphyrin-3 C-methyltransferase [Halomonas caseinilytica]